MGAESYNIPLVNENLGITVASAIIILLNLFNLKFFISYAPSSISSPSPPAVVLV